MKEKKIGLILIQINEAHSTLWPNGLKHTPTPQKSFEERLERANKFVQEEKCPFTVLVDDWKDSFDRKFRAWPDKYYCVDKNLKIIETSSYGSKKDALINKDCLELIRELIQ